MLSCIIDVGPSRPDEYTDLLAHTPRSSRLGGTSTCNGLDTPSEPPKYNKIVIAEQSLKSSERLYRSQPSMTTSKATPSWPDQSPTFDVTEWSFIPLPLDGKHVRVISQKGSRCASASSMWSSMTASACATQEVSPFSCSQLRQLKAASQRGFTTISQDMCQ